MKAIRSFREERGWSQAKLAVTAGMDPATLNRLERGKGNPNLKTLEKIAEALGVSVSALFKGEEAPKAQAPLPLESLGKGDGGGASEEEINAATQQVNAIAILAKDLAIEWSREAKDLHETQSAMSSYRLYEIQTSTIGLHAIFFGSLEVSERGTFDKEQRRNLLTLVSIMQVLSEVCESIKRFAVSSSEEGQIDALARLAEFALPDVPQTYRSDPGWKEAIEEVRELVEEQVAAA